MIKNKQTKYFLSVIYTPSGQCVKSHFVVAFLDLGDNISWSPDSTNMFSIPYELKFGNKKL